MVLPAYNILERTAAAWKRGNRRNNCRLSHCLSVEDAFLFPFHGPAAALGSKSEELMLSVTPSITIKQRSWWHFAVVPIGDKGSPSRYPNGRGRRRSTSALELRRFAAIRDMVGITRRSADGFFPLRFAMKSACARVTLPSLAFPAIGIGRSRRAWCRAAKSQFCDQPFRVMQI